MITNYHTHTERCFHAQGSEEAFILAAIEKGLKVLGFADHGPWPYENYTSGMRMTVEQAKGYVEVLKELREKYKDKIEIKIGFEYEYFPRHMDWLDGFVKALEIDYIILGHHFVPYEIGGAYGGNLNTPELIYAYGDMVCEAIRSGRFAYIAHPDLYMRAYPEFDEHASLVAEKICRTAKEYDAILEYNILGLRKIEREGKEGYPHSAFWELAARKGNRVILGIDAHTPDEITDTRYIAMAENTMKRLGIEVCTRI